LKKQPIRLSIKSDIFSKKSTVLNRLRLWYNKDIIILIDFNLKKGIGEIMRSSDIDTTGVEESPENVEFNEGDKVNILVYKFTDLGASVIIDDKYFGLVYENDIYKDITIGDKLDGYIKKIREDNKIDVSLRKIGYGRIEDAKEKILAKLKQKGGSLPLNDDSSPEQIKKSLQISKGSFKKAIGGLYKEKIINITSKGIRLKK
jgi:hypothetical protein